MEENKVAEVMAEMYIENKRLKETILILEKEIAAINKPCGKIMEEMKDTFESEFKED